MNKVLFAAAVFSFPLFSACTVLPDSRAAAQESSPSEASPAEIRIGNEILKAIKNNDFHLFQSCLKNGPAENLSRKDFEISRKNNEARFGELREFRFLDSLKTPTVRNLIWKAGFRRRGSAGQIIDQELLFRVVTGTLDGKTVVLSFGFL